MKGITKGHSGEKYAFFGVLELRENLEKDTYVFAGICDKRAVWLDKHFQSLYL